MYYSIHKSLSYDRGLYAPRTRYAIDELNFLSTDIEIKHLALEFTKNQTEIKNKTMFLLLYTVIRKGILILCTQIIFNDRVFE